VDALILASLALLVLWVAIVLGRRRAVRRANEARARAQARRARVPVVSSNLRGLSAGTQDLRQESAHGAERAEAAPPAAVPRPER
jgi:hypothetical protein